MCEVMKRVIEREFFELVAKGHLAPSAAAEELGIDEDTFLADMEKAGYNVPASA